MNKHMAEVFQNLGLTPKQIKQANALHQLAVNPNPEPKKSGGAAAVPTQAKDFQKMFDLDDKTMADLLKAHEVAIKQNQLALRKTQKHRGGGQGTELVSMAVGIAVPVFIAIPGGKLGYVAFQVAWRIISQALNKYVDGLPLDDSHLGYIAKLMTWVLPLGAIQYFINITLFDQTKLASVISSTTAETAKSTIASTIAATTTASTIAATTEALKTAAATITAPSTEQSINPDYWSVQQPNPHYIRNYNFNPPKVNIDSSPITPISPNLSDIKTPDNLSNGDDSNLFKTIYEQTAGMFTNVGTKWTSWTEGKTGLTKGIIYIIDSLVASLKFLIETAKGAGGSVVTKFGQDPVIVIISAIVVAFIGKYMYTRFYGNKDQNKDLDKTLYMNWKRRRMIIKAYENRVAREKREQEGRQERYKQKEEEFLESLEQGDEPDEPKEEIKPEEIVRKTPVWYGFEFTNGDRDEFYQKSFKKAASHKKSAKSDRNKEARSQKDDAEFLKKAEEILEKK